MSAGIDQITRPLMESVIRTEELTRRPARPPDYRGENKALAELAHTLADSPRDILDKLAFTAQRVCRAGSAGVSLLSRQDNGSSFRRPAITGAWREQVGSGTPRNFSPCGVVLDRNSTQLFAHPERYYPFLADIAPPITEALLAPFHVHGRAVGVVWVLSHDEQRHFDAEDQRALESIAQFASAAYQVLGSIDELETHGRRLRGAHSEVHQELDATQRLHQLVSRLHDTRDLDEALEEILAESIDFLHADLGNLQLYNAKRGGLEIAVQRGFDAAFLAHFAFVGRDAGSACARALNQHRRVIIHDVARDGEYARHWEIAAHAGYRTVQSTPLFDAAGEWLGVLSTHHRDCHDFTESELRLLDLYAGEAARVIERHRSQLALRESLERIESTLSASEVATWVWDIPNDRVYADANLARLFGVSAADADGGSIQAYLKAIHPEDQAGVRSAIDTTLAGNASQYNIEYRIISADGKIRWVSARGRVQRSADDAPVRSPGVVIDITERKHAEDALREADRRKNEFLAMLAHELRNPLAPIRNGVELLERGMDRTQIEPVVGMMQRQVGHMVRLIDDLLDVSRVSRGKIELRRQPVELGTTIRQAVEANRPFCESRGHSLTVTLPGSPVFLNADLTRLAQIIGNLLSNACKFTDRGGSIGVVVERAGNEAVIRVSDSGIGISNEQLPHIFDLFAQADTSLERAESGLGIGLTLVERLVAMHDGRVEAHSMGLGHGSEFVVHLPIATTTDAATKSASVKVAEKPSRSRRVLIVDDNRDSAASLEMLLQLDGHATAVAHDGEEALAAALGPFHPDVILLDIGLPKLHGYEVARQFRKDPASTGIVLIALTGWGQEEDRLRSREAGFDSHLVKPIDFEALRTLLTEASAGVKP